MWILTFFLGVLFGSIIMGLLAGGETEGESFWRNNYFNEKDSHAGTTKLLDQLKTKE